MLKNEDLRAKIGVDTAENERNFAEILPKLATTLRVHFSPMRVRVSCARPQAAALRDHFRTCRYAQLHDPEAVLAYVSPKSIYLLLTV